LSNDLGFFLFFRLSKEEMKAITWKCLTPEQCKLFNVPEELRKLIGIADYRKVEGGDLYLLKPKADYRDEYIDMMLQKLGPAVLPAQIVQIKSEPNILDIYDNGVAYLVSGPENSQVAKMVRHLHDFTREEILHPNLIEHYFTKTKLGPFREWKEGTTFSIMRFGNEIFYSTKSRLDSSRSRPVQDQNCPFIKDSIIEAFQHAKVDPASIAFPGKCHSFVLRYKWNQLTHSEVIEHPVIMHIGSYDYSGEYKPIEDEIEGVLQSPVLSTEEAIEIVRKGGIVMTCHPFKNIKIMSEETASLYQCLSRASNSPLVEYFTLYAQNRAKAEKLITMLPKQSSDKITSFLAELPVNLEKVVKYVYDCVQLQVLLTKKIASEKKEKANADSEEDVQEEQKKKAYHPMVRDDKNIKNVIRALTTAYYATRSNSSKTKKGDKYYWGGSQQEEEINEKEFIRSYIEKLRITDGNIFYCLIRDCLKYAKQEEIRRERVGGVGGANLGSTIAGSLTIITEEEKDKMKKKGKKEVKEDPKSWIDVVEDAEKEEK
jgi:hypothetical protein